MKLDAGLLPGSGVLIPQEIFIGDQAAYQYRFNVALNEGNAVLELPDSELPLSPDMTVNAVRITVTPGEVAVQISFIPWKTGTVSFPAIVSGDFAIQLPPVRIASILDRTGITVLQEVRPPLLVPGTMLLLYGLALGSLAALLVSITMFIKLRRWYLKSAGKHSVERHSREALKKLRRLERAVSRTALDPWYAAFQQLVRQFLSGITGVAMTACTTPEVTRHLEVLEDGRDERVLNGFAELLAATDVIRFAGTVTADQRQSHCAVLRGLLSSAAAFRLPEEK